MVKTLSKPVSKRIKHDFSRNAYTKQMLINIGQSTHSITSRMTIWSAGYTVRSITPLEVEAALTRGADFVGEVFVLMVSCGTVVWEYNRSSKKDRIKEEARRAEARAERNALQVNFKALDARLKAVEEVVQYNSQSIFNVSGKHYVEPEQRNLELVPISEEEIAQRRQQDQTNSNSKVQATIAKPKDKKSNNDNSKETKTSSEVSEESKSPVVDEEPLNNNNGKGNWWKFW